MLFAELIRHGKIKIRTQYLSLNMNYECAFLNNLMFENFFCVYFHCKSVFIRPQKSNFLTSMPKRAKIKFSRFFRLNFMQTKLIFFIPFHCILRARKNQCVMIVLFLGNH